MTLGTHQYEELLAENRRLKAAGPGGQKATLYVVAIIVLCSLTVIGIVGVVMIRPDRDNGPTINVLIGITAPILIGLLGAAIQQVHLAVNSRLTQLLQLTAESSAAKGALTERDKNLIVSPTDSKKE